MIFRERIFLLEGEIIQVSGDGRGKGVKAKKTK